MITPSQIPGATTPVDTTEAPITGIPASQLTKNFQSQGWGASTSQAMSTQLSRSFQSDILEETMQDIYRTMGYDKQLSQNQQMIDKINNSVAPDLAEIMGIAGSVFQVGSAVTKMNQVVK